MIVITDVRVPGGTFDFFTVLLFSFFSHPYNCIDENVKCGAAVDDIIAYYYYIL